MYFNNLVWFPTFATDVGAIKIHLNNCSRIENKRMTKAQATQETTTPTVKHGTLVYMQFIVTDDTLTDETLENSDTLASLIADGTVKRVRYNQDASLYAGTDTQVYSYTATEGSKENKKSVTKYAVAIADARRAKKSTSTDNINAMLASGLSAQDIQAKLLAQAQAKINAQLAKLTQV